MREEIASEPKSGGHIASVINKGNMLSENDINEFFDKKAKPVVETNAIVVFDGYPRSLTQKDHFDEKMEEWKRPDSVFIFVSISRAETFNRISTRRECAECGTKYGDIDKGVMVCKKCGAKLIVRADEDKEPVKKRLDGYEKNTEPLIEFYRKQGTLIEINGEQTREKVFANINRALESYLI